MKFLFAIIILLLLSFLPTFENFENAQPYKQKKEICPILDIVDEVNPRKECCLIQDEFVQQEGGLYDSKFVYTYKILYDNDCDIKKYDLNSKTQLFINGINNWDNKMCKKGSMGSCRFATNQCIDIQRKEDCDKANLEWSPLPCEENRPMVFDDRLKPSNTLPPMPNYGTPSGLIQFFG